MSLITGHPLPPLTPEPEQRVLLTILVVMPVQGITAWFGRSFYCVAGGPIRSDAHGPPSG